MHRGGALAVILRIGPLPAVTALAFRGDDRLLAVGTYGQVVFWDLHDGQPGGIASGHSRAGSRPGIQPRWAAAWPWAAVCRPGRESCGFTPFPTAR